MSLRESELGEEGFIKLHSAVKRGDIVGVVGSPGLKLTLYCSLSHILPCMHQYFLFLTDCIILT